MAIIIAAFLFFICSFIMLLVGLLKDDVFMAAIGIYTIIPSIIFVIAACVSFS